MVNHISIVSICGVAVATMAIVCVLSVFNGFQDVLGGKLDQLSADVKVTSLKGKVIESADSLIDAIESLPEVAMVMPMVEDNALAVRPYPCAGVVVVLDRDGSFDVLAADTFLPYCPEFCWFGEFLDGAWCEHLDVHWLVSFHAWVLCCRFHALIAKSRPVTLCTHSSHASQVMVQILSCLPCCSTVGFWLQLAQCLMGAWRRCLLISLAFQLLFMVVSLEEFWWFDELGWLGFVEGAVGWVSEYGFDDWDAHVGDACDFL